MTGHYGASSDVFAIMVKTPVGACSNYDTLLRVDHLDWQLHGLEGVDSTNSLALLNRRVLVGLSEGSPKWYELLNNQATLNMVTAGAPRGLYNEDCSLLTLYTYLSDHKADTLSRITNTVEAFARDNDSDQAQFLLAAGNAGIEAATNIVVKQASHEMLWWVYGAVILLCLVTFRSWRAVLCAVLPLMLTSILCEALMVALGIGVKVATPWCARIHNSSSTSVSPRRNRNSDACRWAVARPSVAPAGLKACERFRGSSAGPRHA